jgi:hypothetical protein
MAEPPADHEFDEAFFDALVEAVEAAVASGRIPADRAEEIATSAVAPALEAVVPGIVGRLEEAMPEMLSEHLDRRGHFESTLRGVWGNALDRYYAYCVVALELGEKFNDDGWPAALQEGDVLFEVMTGQLARACRVAHEVHCLLSGGYAAGALARSRSLHEIAVTTIVLSDHGRLPEHADLAERYSLHGAVDQLKDARIYAEVHERLGYEPLEADLLPDLEAECEDLVRRFGSSYAADYGWAAQLVGKPRFGFRDIEVLAGLDHLRGHYRWASHEVHSGARGWALNRVDRAGVLHQETGPSPLGLADAGEMALLSLHQVAVNALSCRGHDSPIGVVGLMVLERLRDQASEALLQAHRNAEIAFLAPTDDH